MTVADTLYDIQWQSFSLHGYQQTCYKTFPLLKLKQKLEKKAKECICEAMK